MPKTPAEAWDDLIRRAKTAGITVAFNHAGVAVLLLPPPAPATATTAPAAAGQQTDLPDSS